MSCDRWVIRCRRRDNCTVLTANIGELKRQSSVFMHNLKEGLLKTKGAKIIHLFSNVNILPSPEMIDIPICIAVSGILL